MKPFLFLVDDLFYHYLEMDLSSGD